MNHSNYRYDPIRPESASSRLREDPPWMSPSDEWEDGNLDEFIRYLRTIESEPTSTLARQLISDGIELPPPQSFSEASVHDKLWEIIQGLARRRHFLSSTDHLSDLELYAHLWELTLNEPTHELDRGMGDCACHLDLVSDGCDESVWNWLRYYADEHTRLDWAADFPGESVPDHCRPPYDRDHFLPKPNFAPWDEP